MRVAQERLLWRQRERPPSAVDRWLGCYHEHPVCRTLERAARSRRMKVVNFNLTLALSSSVHPADSAVSDDEVTSTPIVLPNGRPDVGHSIPTCPDGPSRALARIEVQANDIVRCARASKVCPLVVSAIANHVDGPT